MPVGNKSPRRSRGEDGAGPSASNANRLQKEVYRLELVRLKGEALQLTTSLNGADVLTDRQRREKKELLDLLLDRVRLFVHLTEAENPDAPIPKAKKAAGADDEDGDLFDDYRGPRQELDDVPRAKDAHDDDDDEGEEIPTELLSLRLANSLREKLKPTLEDQLDGLDSPISPPGVITKSLEEVLEEHMDSLTEKKQGSLIEAGRAMVALQRGLAVKAVADAAGNKSPAGREAMMHATSALASASSFELLLYRAKMHSGALYTVNFGEEAVELHVRPEQDFLQLCQDAARYWRVEPEDFCIGDQFGGLWLSRMNVLEAMRLAPSSTKIWLKPVRSAAAEEGVALGGKSDGHAQMLKLKQDQEAKLAEAAGNLLGGDVDIEEMVDDFVDEDDKRVVDQPPRTRSDLVFGLIKVLVLAIVVYLGIDARVNTTTANEMCDSLRSSIVNRPLVPGSPDSFASISSPFQINTFLNRTMPEALWTVRYEDVVDSLVNQGQPLIQPAIEALAIANNYAETVQHPARVAKHNYLVGGVRLRQHRVRSLTYDVCVKKPFLRSNEPGVRSTYTAMQNPILSSWADVIATIGWDGFLDPEEGFSYDAVIQTLYGLSTAITQASLSVRRNASVGLGLGPASRIDAGTAPSEFLRRGGEIAPDGTPFPGVSQRDAEITRIALALDRSRRQNGDPAHCYPAYTPEYASKEDFGPLARNYSERDDGWVYNRLRTTMSPEGRFLPEDKSDPPKQVLEGLLPAWQYRTAEELGDYGRFRIMSYSYNPGGFVFHFPNNITRDDWAFHMTPLIFQGWYDRATRHVFLDMDFLNPNVMIVAHLELKVETSPGGTTQTSTLCGIVPLVDPFHHDNLASNVPDLIMFALIIVMTWDTINTCFEKRGVGYVYIVSGEAYFHFAIAILVVWSLILRIEFVFTQRDWHDSAIIHREENAFQSRVPHLVFLSETSSIALAVAFWLCMVRLSFYYSLFSTRFFLLRKAILRCITALIPALSLIFICILAFGFFAHMAFGSTAPQWSTIPRTIANLVVMTRKPSLMNILEMERADPLTSLGLDFQAVGPAFFIMYTFSVCIIFTAIARSVVIHAYSRVCEEDDGSPPDDLVADSPWPSPNPLVHYREYAKANHQKNKEKAVVTAAHVTATRTAAQQKALHKAYLREEAETKAAREAKPGPQDPKAKRGRFGRRKSKSPKKGKKGDDAV